MPLPVIHYCSLILPKIRRNANRKSQLNNIHKLQTVLPFNCLPLKYSIIFGCNPFRAKNFTTSHKLFVVSTIGGKRARSHATFSCHKLERKREKNSSGRGRITCPLLPARIQKRTRRKVRGNGVCGVSVARRGFPAARRRDRNRSAWRAARPHALRVAPPRGALARAPPYLMAPSCSRAGRRTPPMGGRDFPPSVHGRNMAVPLCRRSQHHHPSGISWRTRSTI